MRQQRRQVMFIVVVLLCVTADPVVGKFSGSGPTSTSTQEQIDTSNYPIVDSTATLPTDPNERANRNRKSKKYNGRTAPPIRESDQIHTITDWELGLPALPVAKSAAIVIGEVSTAQAFLSEDKSAVYSEFGIRIDEVLKTETRFPVVSGSVLPVERMGGLVRFPSGKLAVSIVDKQDMPHIGGRYVLFLVHRFSSETEDFHILTGYELRSGRVSLLDRITSGPMAAYRGTDEVSLLKDLRIAIANVP